MLRTHLGVAGCALLGTVVLSWTVDAALAVEKLPETAKADTAAREQVQEALRAEARGDNAARARGLTSAWLAAPDLAEANWHLGRVQVNGEWLKLEDAELAAGCDPVLEEYRALRDGADTGKKLLALARWCVKAGMDDASRLHYAQLLARRDTDDKARQEAIKRLDLHQVSGQWITGEELAARQAEAKAIEAAMAKWRPKIKALQDVIDGVDLTKRLKAIDEFQQIAQPELIPVLESFVAEGHGRFHVEAVRRLSEFPHVESTEALIRFAVLSENPLARQRAVEQLKTRPLHETCPPLLAALQSPLQSRYAVEFDRSGRVHYTHAIRREGESQNYLFVSKRTGVLQLFRRTIAFSTGTPGGGSVTIGDSPAKRMNDVAAEAAIAARIRQTQVNLTNRDLKAANERLLDVLQQLTGQRQQQEPSQWWQWWQDYNEYQWPKPTQFAFQRGQSYYPVNQLTVMKVSCFAAGTHVRTISGSVPIEGIKLGDQVLTQDQDTGELAYKVVLRTTVRPPSKLVRINTGAEEIETTLGHPFWVSGHGWKMAKELQSGDLLHTLGGTVAVERVDRLAEPAEAYNLVVDGFNTYFVGDKGLLVHDNEFRKPTRAIVPGLVAD